MKREYKIAWIGFAGTVIAAAITIIFTVSYERANKSIKNEILSSKFENPLNLNFYPQYNFDFNKGKRLKLEMNNELKDYLFGIGISDKNGSMQDKILSADRRGLLDLSLSLKTYIISTVFFQQEEDIDNYVFEEEIISDYVNAKEFYLLRRIYFNEVVLSIIITRQGNGLKNLKLKDCYNLDEIDDILKKSGNQSLALENYNIKIESKVGENPNQRNNNFSIKYPYEELLLDGVIESFVSQDDISAKHLDFLNESRKFDDGNYMYPAINISNNYFYGHMRNKIHILSEISQSASTYIQSETSFSSSDSHMVSMSMSKSYNKLTNLELNYFEIDNTVLLERYSIKSENIESLNFSNLTKK